MLINDNNKKSPMEHQMFTNPNIKNIDINDRLGTDNAPSSLFMPLVFNSNFPQRLSVDNNTNPNTNTNTNNNVAVNENGFHRSSFDTNSKLGSFSHSNENAVSPYLSSFPAFKQPFTENSLNSNTKHVNDQVLQPPVSFSSSSFLFQTNDVNENNISPLTPQKSSFSDVPLPLSQDMFTSPLSKANEFSPSRLSHCSSNSMGLLPNIEEIRLDNNYNNNNHDDDDNNANIHINTSLLTQQQQQQYLQQKSKNNSIDIWSESSSSYKNHNNNNSYFVSSQQNSENGYSWASPPIAEFSPLRRYSYDAATASTFIPHRNSNVMNITDYNGNYLNASNFRNNSNYSRHSLGSHLVSQFNELNFNSSNIVCPTKEQIIQSFNTVSNYLGVPSNEVLNIENYLSYLIGNSLPELTYPIDGPSISNFEIIACCFKNARIDVFHISPNNKPFLNNLKIGDLVIVEADRGRDLGKVVKLNLTILEARLLRFAQYLGRKAALSKEEENHKKPVLNFPKPVIRFARNEELLTINSKINNEIKAVEVCQNKIREYGLNMVIVDAEYQWDMKKLTFYYNAEMRIDFRDLVKELFRIYKIRIWMSKQGGIC